MKKPISLVMFLLVIVSLLVSTVSFQSCKKDDDDNGCDTCTALYKPNIYIYPESTIQLTIKLDFPKGGMIIKSIPKYGDGWNISVDSNGKIDNLYSYLFYESKQPDVWQKEKGWIIKQEGLKEFFIKNMTEYGFKGQEIQDFIKYWIPRLNDFDFYAIYPQELEVIKDVVKLSFSKDPANLLRIYYVIEGFNNFPKINNKFERKGFFITEWGVILDDNQ